MKKANALSRDLPYPDGYQLGVDGDYYTMLPEAELVIYFNRGQLPEIEDFEDIEEEAS